jgi:hypothetical protein
MAFPPNFQPPQASAKPQTKYDMATQTHKVIKPKVKGKKPNPFAKKGAAPATPPQGNSYAPAKPF